MNPSKQWTHEGWFLSPSQFLLSTFFCGKQAEQILLFSAQSRGQSQGACRLGQ